MWLQAMLPLKLPARYMWPFHRGMWPRATALACCAPAIQVVDAPPCLSTIPQAALVGAKGAHVVTGHATTQTASKIHVALPPWYVAAGDRAGLLRACHSSRRCSTMSIND